MTGAWSASDPPPGATVLMVTSYNADDTISRRAWRLPLCGHGHGEICPELLDGLVAQLGQPVAVSVESAEEARVRLAANPAPPSSFIPDDPSDLTGG